MARPTAFTRQTSFTQFSSNFPSKQQNGASLDAEFNAAKVALDETQSNLALIQDDDGELARGSVGRAQLDSSITLGFESPSTWQADTSYTADISTVFHEAKFYIALETHTSSDTFDAAKWEEIADLSASAAIEDGSITEAKLASSAATADKIGPLAVTTPKIASGAVTNSKLANGAVTRTKVDDSAGPDLAALILPAGLGPLPWTSGVAPPGWVLDGATYNRADYPELAAHAIAQAGMGNGWFGVGNGSTTFVIESGAGRAIVGADFDGSIIGSVVGIGGLAGIKARAIAQANLPNVAPTFAGAFATVNSTSTVANVVQATIANTNFLAGTGGSATSALAPGAGSSAITSQGNITPAGTISSINGGVTQTDLPIIQPSIGVRFIFKAH